MRIVERKTGCGRCVRLFGSALSSSSRLRSSNKLDDDINICCNNSVMVGELEDDLRVAKRMREWLEDVLPEDVEANLEELQALRRELKGDFAQKQATLRALTRHFRDQKAS